MSYVEDLKNKVLDGHQTSRDEALRLLEEPLEELCQAADQLRRHFCGSGFDICTIINGKCGKCSEDCKYCAQSAHYQGNNNELEAYPLLDTEAILAEARHNHQQGVLRFSIVTSGRRLSDPEIDKVCESIRAIRAQTGLAVCISFGLLEEDQFRRLREAGASRVHCNMESSANFFPNVCTTHTYADKIATLQAARRAGLSICSGGIFGLGETLEDRIDMALTLRELGVRSVPVNLLNPIPGTPYEHNQPVADEEARRCIAIYRFLLPEASIRMAGGRGLLPDKGRGAFQSGANAAISGDMLTTSGITIATDMQMLQELGYEARLCNND